MATVNPLKFLLLFTSFFWFPQLSTGAEAEVLPIRTFFVTRSLNHEKLLPYLEEARPQIVQIGNYGAMFHGYAGDPKSTGWPMQLPVSGEKTALAFQKDLNDKVHQLGLKVVGHFRVTKVMADWEEGTGFVKYYNEDWQTKLLGPKPHSDLKELLQRDSSGKPIQTGRYGNAQLQLCLTSPHARKMLKSMLKVAIENGVDGVMTNFNYHSNCACPHCQTSFKNWLQQERTPEQIKTLGVENLASHTFSVIPAKIPGYPDKETATDLDFLAMKWAAWNFKKCFDEIFLDYGRTLKPGLIVGQWNHLSHVSLSEERMFLPLPSWHQGEDYFWYSGGAAFVGKNLNLQERKAGDAWLSCLYVRELAAGKSFVMGKYDGMRLAASMAEGYATGGMGMGRYMRFEDPVGYEVLVRYTKFLHKHRHLYDGAKPYADLGLVLPRQSVWNQHPESLDTFREVGQALLEKQVLLDVIADENLTLERLSNYPAIVLPNVVSLSDSQLKAIQEYSSQGGKVLTIGKAAREDEKGNPRSNPNIPNHIPISSNTEQIFPHLLAQGFTQIQAPWTIRATAYTQPNRLLLHLVNYNRDEAKAGKLKAPSAEHPIPEKNISVEIRLHKGKEAKSVTLHSPNRSDPILLKFSQNGEHLKFTVPEVLVYGVVEVEMLDN
jgi:hypothetical protein